MTAMLRALCLLSILVLVPLAPAPGQAATPEQGAAFVKDLADRALEALGKFKNLSKADRETRFREVMHTGFDIPTIGRFVVGPTWRKASEAERARYLELFERYIVQTYAARLAEYDDEKIAVAAARADDGDVVVASQILRKSGPPVKIDWRLREAKAGGLRVIDVVIEGISMAVSQRSEFASVIQQGGGEMAPLIKLLGEKTGG
ncbi:MAG: ABC transporter substrate-binding protein [Alphaproteobacteria bacterium]|nr:ABC transporter substrate-binding protein [Alphaproteobacteria bacterium]